MRYEEPAYKKYLARPNRVSGKKRIKFKNKEYDTTRDPVEVLEEMYPHPKKKRIIMRD